MYKETNHHLKAHMAGVLFSLLVGFSFMSVKICVPLATPLQILAYRYSFAFLAVISVILLRINRVTPGKLRSPGLLLAAAFYVGFMVLQTAGLVFSTSVEAAIFFAVIPIFAKIIARMLLGEKSTILQDLFMTISIGALITMIVLGATSIEFNLLGAALLILASAAMALSNVLMRQIRGEFTPFEITFSISVGGFLIFASAAGVEALVNGTLGELAALLGNRDFMIATAYLGVFCILITSQLMSYMMAHMAAVQGTLYGNLSTAISVVAGVALLSEPLEIYHIICTILIIAGVAGISLSGRQAAAIDKNPGRD